MEKLDFQTIKRIVTMEKAIKFLGLVGKFEQPTQFRCACPACKPEGRRELSISTEKNVFRCYAATGQVAGDVIYLVAHVKGIKQGDAARLLFEEFMREPEKPKRRESRKKAATPKKPVQDRGQGKGQDAVVGGNANPDGEYSIVDWLQL